MGLNIAQANAAPMPAFSRLVPAFQRQGNSTAPDKGSGVAPSSRDKAPGIAENRSAAIQDAYEAMVYSSRLSRVSLSQSLISSSIGNDSDASSPASELQQLEFSFVGEIREETLVRFQQRTRSVADALDETQRSTYIEASRSVAARFQASFKVSGEALAGFASASEGAQNNDDVVSRLVDLVNQLFEKSDEFFNEVLGLLEGYFGGGPENEESLASLQDFFDEIFAQFFGQNANAPASGSGTQTASVQLEFKFSFEMSIEVTATEGQVQQSDPLVFDLDGDGIELTNYRDGARFDLLGNGQQVQAAFVSGGDAFLAIDRNGDGLIKSGKELFGEQNGAGNGFEELRKLDTNADGVIDRADRDFGKLSLFKDNGNGITEKGELVSLAEAGVESISLGYTNVHERAAGGNVISQIASFRRAGGAYGRVADALLNYTV